MSQAPAPLGSKFVGRVQELKELDQAWSSGQASVVGIIGWGGSGKSSLVRHWIYQHEKTPELSWQGMPPDAIFWQTFRTEGDLERFFADAIHYFSGKRPKMQDLETLYLKLNGLREAVKDRRYVLVLDGLDTLQDTAPGDGFARAKDPSLAALQRELVEGRMGKGLCVITSRLRLADLEPYGGRGFQSIDLDRCPLSIEESRMLLQLEGVSQGTEDEKDELIQVCGGHPLALKMAANLLARYKNGRAAGWKELERLDWKSPPPGREQEQHLWRVYRWYDNALTESDKRLIVLIAHFREPVRPEWLAYLVKTNASEPSSYILWTEDDLHSAFNKLFNFRLVQPGQRTNAFSAHPLVNEHYRDPTIVDATMSRSIHDRLYRLYKESIAAKQLPETLDDVRPLVEAVYHGCKAGRFQEALEEIYTTRILHGKSLDSTRVPWAFGARLDALTGFFDQQWNRPVTGLTEWQRGYVLNEAGVCLQAAGRLEEAVQPQQAAYEAVTNGMAAGDDIDIYITRTQAALNLCELHLALGRLPQAEQSALQALEFSRHVPVTGIKAKSAAHVAFVLLQKGEWLQAEILFRMAEKVQLPGASELLPLYGVPGFWYCELLTDRAELVVSGRDQRNELERNGEPRWLSPNGTGPQESDHG